MDGIPLAECKHRHVYSLRSRNLAVGVFNALSRSFYGIREKFGDLFLFDEYHKEMGPPFGTATPLEEISTLPESIPLTLREDTIDWETRRLVKFDHSYGHDGKKLGWFFCDSGEYSRNIRPVAQTNKELFAFLLALDPHELPESDDGE